MNPHPHLEEALQQDIDHIQRKVAEMADFAERALKASIQALTEHNRQLAYSIILRDQYIDELETELDRLCLEFLARHQPVARNLRLVFTTIHVNRELERVGDYAESIARQILVLSEIEPRPAYDKFLELGNLAVHMLHDAVHSFQHQDAELAAHTMLIEERANLMRNSIGADLRQCVQANRLPEPSLTPLLTVSRRLERITDQAKNICEEALYLCTGEFIKHKGAEGFRILFLDPSNGCLSQMAEGIANALHQPRFAFASAGITPQPLDDRVPKFMSSKGIGLANYVSKSLEQVPGWEHYQVIVCFGAQVREAVPAHAGKTIFFIWPGKEPLAAAAPPADPIPVFEDIYHLLDSHIRELVGAILQDPQPELKL